MLERDRISLVRSAQAGDELAFAEGDYHLAEDAAQEAFVDAYRELRSLREPAAFGRWLCTIVFKHCDRLTRGKRPVLSGLESASFPNVLSGATHELSPAKPVA